jgi:HSP20 family protein
MIYRKLYGIPTWDFNRPFQELERMRQQMDNLLSRASEGGFAGLSAGVFPLINLTEDKDSYYIRAELPGMAAGDLNIEATGNNLSISGERKIGVEKEDVRYHRREREAGKFSRVITLPGDIDAEGVNASLTNGILTVSIPKAEKAKPKQITIQ